MKRTNSAEWLPKYNCWQIKVQHDNVRHTFRSYLPKQNLRSIDREPGRIECHTRADEWLKTGVKPKKQTVETLWNEYIDNLKETKAKTTWHQPESFGRIWVIPKLGKKCVAKLNDDDFQSILEAAAAKGLSKKTIQDIKNETSKFFKWCRRKKLTAYTPSDVAVPGNARLGRKRILQPAHLRILFQSEQTTYSGKPVIDELIHCYRYMVLTGIRPGEVLGLRDRDITKDFHVTTINGAINSYGERTRGKNDNAIRSMINCKLAAFELETQRNKYPCKRQSDLVFGEYTQEALRDQWERYCKANNIPKVTPYELRHTFLSYTQKYKAFDINAYVGHAKEIDSYIHDVDGYDEYKAEVINSIFIDILHPKNKNTHLENEKIIDFAELKNKGSIINVGVAPHRAYKKKIKKESIYEENPLK